MTGSMFVDKAPYHGVERRKPHVVMWSGFGDHMKKPYVAKFSLVLCMLMM